MTSSDTARQARPWATIAGYARARTALRPRLSRGEDLLTVLFGSWLIAGLFIDGWAHNNDKPETFFTPWHFILYSGFAATALWIFSRVLRHRGIPTGYGLGLFGVVCFALGAVGDLAWHEVFGIEVNLAALVSPSHLTLFVSALLFLTSPVRAAWSDLGSSRSASFAELSPALISVTLATATVAFFFQEFSPFVASAPTGEQYLAAGGPDGWLTEKLQLEGLAAILITTAIFMTPTLLLLRRWLLPFGSLTLLFGVSSALMSGIRSFELGWTVLAGVVAGMAADVVVRLLRPTPSRPGALRAVGAVVPAVLWLAYFGVLAAFYSVAWDVDLWAGSIVLATLTGFGLSLLVAPPALPAGLDSADPGTPGLEAIEYAEQPPAVR